MLLLSTEITTSDVLAFFFSIIFMAILIPIMIIGYVINSLLLSFLFKKTEEKMWKAWVPFYNVWVFAEIAGWKGWVGLTASIASSALAWVPFLNFLIAVAAYIVMLLMALNIQKAMNKETIFILWWVFIPVVWYAILAFDRSEYDRSSLEPVTPEAFAKNS